MHAIDLLNALDDATTGADQKVVCVLSNYDGDYDGNFEVTDVVVCPKTGNIHIILK